MDASTVWVSRRPKVKSPASLFFAICLCSKLDEEYKERVAALKNELQKDREQIQQQASKQQAELEEEVEQLKREENFLRDHLALTLKVRWGRMRSQGGWAPGRSKTPSIPEVECVPHCLIAWSTPQFPCSSNAV